MAYRAWVYRSHREGQLAQRIRDLETEIAELLAAQEKFNIQEGYRAERRAALAEAFKKRHALQVSVEQKKKLIEQARTPAGVNIPYSPGTEPASVRRGRQGLVVLAGSAVTWFSVFVLSGEWVPAFWSACVPAVLAVIVWSGWRGDGL